MSERCIFSHSQMCITAAMNVIGSTSDEDHGICFCNYAAMKAYIHTPLGATLYLENFPHFIYVTHLTIKVSYHHEQWTLFI